MPSESDLWLEASGAHRAGRLNEAAAVYSQILQNDPTHAGALHQLGLLLHQQGRPAEAIQLLKAALRIIPDAPHVLCNAAVVLHSLKRYKEALGMLDRALAAEPEFSAAHGNRGLVLQSIGRHAEAIKSFDKALAKIADPADILHRRANSLFALQRYDEAASAYLQLLEFRPTSASLHWCLGNTLLALNRTEDALASFDRAILLQPHYPEALLNRGDALNALQRHKEALASFDDALRLRPDFPEALSNRGHTLLELAHYDEAVASCDAALALRPNYAQAHWNRCLIRLLQGELAEGLREYEWRWKRPEIAPWVRAFHQPLWNGESCLQGKTILLHAEQGIGDTLQFLRYVPLVAARRARIVLEVQAPLKRFLSTFPGVAHVLAQGEDLPAFDVHCPLLSLPLAFRTTINTIPAEIPYLSVPGNQLAAWKNRLPATGPLVGLVWSGNPANKGDWKRSIPLTSLVPFFSLPGIRFVSLQYDVPEKDLPALTECTEIIRLPIGEFADTAAVIGNLDLVLSVDTAAAHLAGALNKPVWILLPKVPDWRWLLERDDSPWYPTARLFRQRNGETWEEPVRRVRDALVSAFGSQ